MWNCWLIQIVSVAFLKKGDIAISVASFPGLLLVKVVEGLGTRLAIVLIIITFTGFTKYFLIL